MPSSRVGTGQGRRLSVSYFCNEKLHNSREALLACPLLPVCLGDCVNKPPRALRLLLCTLTWSADPINTGSCFRQGNWADVRDRFLSILIRGDTVYDRTPQMPSHENFTQCCVEGVVMSHLGFKNWNRFSFKTSCLFIRMYK